MRSTILLVGTSLVLSVVLSPPICTPGGLLAAAATRRERFSLCCEVCSTEDEGWLQAKLKIAVAQEDYVTAAKLKSQLEVLIGDEASPEPLSPPPSSGIESSSAHAKQPRREPATSISSAVALAADGAAVTAALEADGVVRVNGAITASMASELLEFVNAELERALIETRSEDEFGPQWQRRFGNVLGRNHRHDMKLHLGAPPVRAALACLLGTLQPAIARQLGDDAELYELAALISLPGAARQPVHPDTPIVAGKGTDEGATILTAFCALQDIDASMGPTLFLPATHTAAAHASFFTYDNFDLAFDSDGDDDGDGDGAADAEDDREARAVALLASWNTWRSTLCTGDVSLFDSRCLHSGAANTSPRPRVLFYFSFIKANYASACDGTLLESLRGEHALGEWRDWLSADGPDVGG